MTNFQAIGFRGRLVATWIQSTPSVVHSDICLEVDTHPITITMESDDPWFWDVDRVVLELCAERKSWVLPTDPPRRMPNPILLEKSFREQEIDGVTLLTEVDESVLENRLGIVVFGQLAAVKQAIRDLRRMSEQYRIWKNTYGSEISLAAHVPQSDFGISHIRKRSRSPESAGCNKRQKVRSASSESQAEPSGSHLHQPVVTHHGSHLAESAPDGGGDRVEFCTTKDIISTSDDSDQTTVLVGKRKRIAPTLVTSSINTDRNREIPTEADMVIDNDPTNIEPGVIYRGEDGKRRLMLPPQSELEFDLQKRHQDRLWPGIPRNQDLQLGGQRALEAAEQILRAAQQKDADAHIDDISVGYLGRKKHSVDEVFYRGVKIGAELQQLDEDENFILVKNGRTLQGRSLYVQKLMKRYLRSKPRSICRNGKYMLARIPYAARLAPMHQAPSFTLIEANDRHEIKATRENLLKWSELDSHPETKGNNISRCDDERRAQFDLPDNLTLGGPSSYDSWDPDLLEKYRYIDGGDAVLPLYGESDEEGEYDIETWNEIEEERGTLDKPLIAMKKRRLTNEEVNTAIDEGIAEIVLRWNMEKLPKRHFRVWKQWKRSRRDGSKLRMIREARQHLDRINNKRLPSMRESILDEIWTSQKQVRRQTKIMEPSIFDREDKLFEISTLERDLEPEKPQLHGALTQKPKVTSGTGDRDGDGEHIVFTDVESSNDDLDNFIMSDDSNIISADGVHMRAEDEAEDLTSGSEVSNDSRTDDSMLKDRSNAIPVRASQAALSARGSPHTEDESEILNGDDSDRPASVLRDGSMSNSPKLALRLANEEKMQLESKLLLSQGQPRHPQRSIVDVIDLTQTTSDTSGAEFPSMIDLLTPSKLKNNIRLTFKREKTPIRISSSEEIAPQEPPPYTDPTSIAQFSRLSWQKAGDRDRLLIWELYHMKPQPKEDLLELFSARTVSKMWAGMVDVMHAIRDDTRVRGINEKTFMSLTGVFRLFEMYADCRYRGPRTALPTATVEKIKGNEKLFQQFYDRCYETLNILLQDVDEINSLDSDSEPVTARRRIFKTSNASANPSDSEELAAQNPHKLRKKKVFENAQARDLREQDRQRLLEQEERRRILQHKLSQSDSGLNADEARIIINDAKHDDQGFVYVHEEIRTRIKAHQIEGIRFMWSQIVTNEKLQGCLLAHTMGLGKTMQVISLLVAIAEASKSPEASISSQIPHSLRVSQTLVLCPPGLIDNWMDELLTWAPPGILGHYRKIDSSMRMQTRLKEIDSWHKGGGILIMGYEMFRMLIHNRGTVRQEASLGDRDHAVVLGQLLNTPNLIIADEAHKMKNASSSITQAANQFKSKSRIALTGSPLANNVEEYHTMIEWVAPNYLGPIVEFRSKYVEPIEQGLWLDSTPYERRRSLKMLGVLKEDLSPKVHRADMSVLRNDLKKTDFVIKVPLTELQEKLYCLYVRAMLEKPNELTKDGQLQQTTLWHWLSILTLNCNHPECFRRKISERREDSSKDAEGKNSGDDPIPGAPPIWKVGVSEDLIRQMMDLFRNSESPIGAIKNSNKVKLLLQILDASKAAGDKVLVFSHSIQTLDYLEELCKRTQRHYARLDGSTKMNTRQALTKDFNTGRTELYLISTRAGGLGLNLQGANRVIIFDFGFNPINEEQAVGRAYRIGQKKPVFVYRFVAGGTFEETIHNKVVFKMQLASRVVDKKNPIAWAKRNIGEFLFEPKPVKQEDLSGCKGRDPYVLDKLLSSPDISIRGIVTTDKFDRHDNDMLTAEEQNEVRQLVSDEKLKRSDPKAWDALVETRNRTTQSQVLASLGVSIPHQKHLASTLFSTFSSTKQKVRQDVSRIEAIGPKPSGTISDYAPSSSSLPTRMPEMTPIVGANTKVQPSTPSAGGYFNDAGLPEAKVLNPRVERNPPDHTGSSARHLPTSKISTLLEKGIESQENTHTAIKKDGQDLGVKDSSQQAERVIRVAIKKADRLGKSDVSSPSSFSRRQIDQAATSLREALERDHPNLLKTGPQEIARSLLNDPTIVGRLLSKEVTADSVIARTLKKSQPTMITTITHPNQKLKGNISTSEGQARSTSGNVLTDERPAGLLESPIATTPLIISREKRRDFISSFKSAMQATIDSRNLNLQSDLPRFPQSTSNIAHSVVLELATTARDQITFDAAAAIALREISIFQTCVGVMGSNVEARDFAKRVVAQSMTTQISYSGGPEDTENLGTFPHLP